MGNLTDVISSIIGDCISKMDELPQDDVEVKYFTKSLHNLFNELNMEYVYFKYKFSEHDDWEYAKFDKRYFECLTKDGDDELEEEVLNFPGNTWMRDSWRSYSITYEICSRSEYEKIKGF